MSTRKPVNDQNLAIAKNVSGAALNKELKRKQKLENTKNLGNIVKTSTPALKKTKLGDPNAPDQQILNKKMPSALPKGFIGKGVAQNFTMTSSSSCRDPRAMENQLGLSSVKNLVRLNQNDVLFSQSMGVHPMRGVSSPQQHQQFRMMDPRTGRILSPLSQGQLSANFSGMANIRQQIVTPNQNLHFVPILDIAAKNRSKQNMEVLIQNSQVIEDHPNEETEHSMEIADTVLLNGQNNFDEMFETQTQDLDSLEEDKDQPQDDDSNMMNGSNDGDREGLSQTDDDANKELEEETPSTSKQELNSTDAAAALADPLDDHLHDIHCCRMCRRMTQLLILKVEKCLQILEDQQNRERNQRPQAAQVEAQAQNAGIEEVQLLPEFPLREYEHLRAMSTQLEKNTRMENRLISVLCDCKVSGEPKKTARLMMSHVISDLLADGLTWKQPRKGSGKEKVHKLYFIDVVTSAVKREFPAQSREDIRKVLKDWITRSSDRLRNATNDNEQEDPLLNNEQEADSSGAE